MTIAIRRESGELIWFDAVTRFDKNMTAQVTSHPLESGSKVTDHVTVDNHQLTIEGVLSDADFNTNRPIISPSDASRLGWSNKQFVNNTPVSPESAVQIQGASGWTQLLPDSIGQFLGSGSPRVTVTDVQKIKPAYSVRQDFETIFENAELVEVLSFMGDVLQDPIFENCIIKSLSFPEDASTGDSINVNMQLEQVKFATSTTVRVAKQTDKSIENQASQVSEKGKQTSTEGNIDQTEGLDPSKPTNLRENTAAQRVRNFINQP